jgi:DNA repair exonuclease SbcCD nuclease subunit
MGNLFKRALVLTDLHFGLKSNSQVHNDDCAAFIKWAISVAKAQNCETCFCLGDWHNNRASINILTLNYSLEALEQLNANFTNVYFIPGNHDLYYRDRRDVQSVSWAKHLSNVRICNDWFIDSNVIIAPWLVADDHKRIPKMSAKYMFGHFELPHFYMNAMVQMPDHGEIKHEHFQGIEQVFTGHFHKRQQRNNITYIGNCFPHNYADAGDDQRGVMILEWDKPPEFHSWPHQPTYRNLNLSDLLHNADNILREKMHVRVSLDIDISYEEANFIKETFIESHKLREITLMPSKNHDLTQYEIKGNIEFESVDQIVTNQLTAISSEHYDNKLLLDIYRNL